MDTKIFVTADNHIGKHLKKRKYFRDFAIRNFRSIPNKIPSDVEYVVFAGDIFDKQDSDIECYNAYIEVLSKITDMSNVKNIFIITGNHDMYSNFYNSASIDLAKSINNSNKIIMCNKDYLVWNDEKILVGLLPYSRDLFINDEMGRRKIFNYLAQLQFEAHNVDSEFKILISHFAITDWMPFATGITLEELIDNKFFNLIIMGDLHNEEYEKVDPETTVLYTGSTFHTMIKDLYQHENVSKIITIKDDCIDSIERVRYPKPTIYKINKDNVDDEIYQPAELGQLDLQDIIIITDDIDIHNELKDRVIYSEYSPKMIKMLEGAKNDGSVQNDTEKPLDINQICLQRINEDQTLDEDTKIYLTSLLNIDTDSMDNSSINEKVKELTLGDIEE